MKTYQPQQEQKHLRQQLPKLISHPQTQFRHRDRGIQAGRMKIG